MGAEAKYSSIGWTAARLARQVELALATMDLSTAQYRALVQLARGSEASTALARQLAVSAPSVTAVVDGLAQRGAVERTHSTEDRRRISLALTDKGRELLVAAEAVVSEKLTSVASELEDPERVQEALQALELWSEALDRARARRLAARVGSEVGGTA